MPFHLLLSEYQSQTVPESSPISLSLAESYEACRVLTRRTAHNFRFSFLTLPFEKRRAMNALYAFNRITDDLGDDETRSLEERRLLLAVWRDTVRSSLSGDDVNEREAVTISHVDVRACLPAIIDMVAAHHVPHEYLMAVIDGVERDLFPVSIATFEELEQYCYHVAGAVGLCCIHVWGFREAPEVRQLAIHCGLALQLTNILRDLVEDSDRNRVYLPQEDLDRFGYSSADLSQRINDRRFQDLMRFEADRALGFYSSGERLLGYLDPAGRPILRAMLDIYGGLLREMERRDFDVFSHRVSLPKWKKLWYAGRALLPRFLGGVR